MAFTIEWSGRASRDLLEIEAYIAKDNAPAAQREAGDIIRSVDLLAEFPRRGSVYRRAHGLEFRSVLSGRYRIVYLLDESNRGISIVTVRHGARGEMELP